MGLDSTFYKAKEVQYYRNHRTLNNYICQLIRQDWQPDYDGGCVELPADILWKLLDYDITKQEKKLIRKLIKKAAKNTIIYSGSW